MKRKHVLVALICIAICLSYVMTACSPETNEIPRNFEAACFPGSNVILYKADPTLLTSQDELESYRNSYTFSGANAEVLEKMDSYSSGFFDEKMLIVIHLSEASGSYEITVEKVDFADSKAQVTLKREIPHACTDDIKIWSIFIEVDAQEIESVGYTVVEEFVEEK